MDKIIFPVSVLKAVFTASLLFAGATQANAQSQTAPLINVTDTFNWTTPSPDPSGVVFVPGANALFVADSEVNETALFTGSNLFQTELDGGLLETFSTLDFTDEPAGITVNPANGHLFISTDNAPRRVYEVNPGSDGVYRSADDIITSFRTTSFGSLDPEGLTYHPLDGRLYIVDGEANLVFAVDPGVNQLFDGVAPVGDDTVDVFDTSNLGIVDPEGIAYDAVTEGLYIIGEPENQLLHVGTDGTFVRLVTLDSPLLRKPAGLAMGPSSLGNGGQSLFLVDRGVDNDADPDENDGRLFEFALPPLPGNQLPVVNITTPVAGQGVAPNTPITFTGVAIDPEEGDLSAGLLWQSDLDGPIGSGPTFTTASLSSGLHQITASVIDSTQSQSFNSIGLRIFPQGRVIIESRVASSEDDAEQRGPGGNTWLSSDDLELVTDNTVVQTVGLRFTGLQIPTGAVIEEAFIQFKAEESRTGFVNLEIRAQATDNAEPIVRERGNIAGRSTTLASSVWQPLPWPTVGEAGVAQRSSDLSAVVQEVVNRPGWSSGNAMAFLVNGSGPNRRTAESFDGDAGGAPLLFVEYREVAAAPEITLISPANGDTFSTGTPVILSASATDAQDGNLSDAIVWESAVDGPLGSGSSVIANNLTAGVQLITATVVNSAGRVSSAGVSIVIEPALNTTPSLAITAPLDGFQTIAGTPVDFSATASDLEDGDLSGVVFWTSDLDGSLGSGASITAASLSVGTHLITATVSDSGGLMAAATLSVTVDTPLNSTPVLTLTTPVEGFDITAGTPVTLTATALDAEDGDVSADIVWVSNLDGNLGSGPSVIARSLSIGTHLITASVSDSGGLNDAATLPIIVSSPSNTALVLVISSPAAGTVIDVDTELSLQASAIDAEDGDLSASVSWSSDLDGSLGVGAPTVMLSEGLHTLTATVTDADALTVTALVTVQVDAVAGQDVTISVRVNAGSDDAEERGSRGRMALTSGDLELVTDRTRDQVVGMRFANVAIPRGAGIVSAFIQFQVDEPTSDLTVLDIFIQESVNPSTFTLNRFDIALRPRSSLSVDWLPSRWLAAGDAGVAQQTSNLNALVQRIVSHDDWSTGNAMVFLVEGDGTRTAEAFEGDADGAPQLTVTYTLDNSAPTVNVSNDLTVTLGDTVLVSGTVIDDGRPVDSRATSTQWTVADDQGAVTIDDPLSLSTAVSFSTPGVYTLILSASDGELTSFDEVNVTVEPSPANQPPLVSAGPDRLVAVGDTVFLDGTVTDDGLPGPDTPVNISWVQLDGPADAILGSAGSAGTVVQFSQEGTYEFELSAFDGELLASDQVIVTVADTLGSARIVRQISDDDDDAEESASGSVDLSSSDLELTTEKSNQVVGMRFQSIAIPNAATITNAYVQFTTDERDTGSTNLIIQGESADSSAVFTTADLSLSSRLRTQSAVSWVPAAWNDAGESSQRQATPDLTSVIQEIVDRPGWVNGNALSIIITGDGTRTAEAHDGDEQSAARLFIDFQVN